MTGEMLDPGAMRSLAQQGDNMQQGPTRQERGGKLSFDMNRFNQQVFGGTLSYKQLQSVRGEIDAALQEVEKELEQEERKMGNTGGGIAGGGTDGGTGVEEDEERARREENATTDHAQAMENDAVENGPKAEAPETEDTGISQQEQRQQQEQEHQQQQQEQEQPAHHDQGLEQMHGHDGQDNRCTNPDTDMQTAVDVDADADKSGADVNGKEGDVAME